MDITIYSKHGDMSDARGFGLDVISYDDNSFSKPRIYGEEITEEEYEELSKLFTSDAKRGFEGVVNDEGYAKYLEAIKKYE